MQNTMKRILLVVAGFGACVAGLVASVAVASFIPLAVNDSPGAAMARYNLTLAQWAQAEPEQAVAVGANLRASSNHFVIGSIHPEGETVKPGQALA